MSNNRNFMEMLEKQWEDGKFLCVGMDSEFKRIPRVIKDADGKVNFLETMVSFNTDILWQTCDLVCAYMINDAFYKAFGNDGLIAMQETIERIHQIAPKTPVLLNICAGDVGNSNLRTIEYVFGKLDADGVTINPYFGQEALQPFLDLREKGVVVLCRTSNLGAGEFQDVISQFDNVPLYRTVACRVSWYWNQNRNCALLMGLASHGEIGELREVIPDLPIFFTGIGPQSKTGNIEEDDVKEIVVNGKNKEGKGFIICSSRGVIFSANPHQEALRLHNLIHKYLYT